MKKLLIIYHSRSGNTEAMAKAVYEGAVSSGVTVSLKKADDATGEDLLDCDAVIFGTSTNFNYMSGIMKEFFERAFITVGDKPANKPYCAFASSGSGTRGALDSVDRICDAFNQRKQFNFNRALEGVVATMKPSSDIIEQCRELGKKMAQL